ncbi:hypothetical protein BU15DRAFT_78095 [Melanogaster broomeanus]|nr:hypothetical protein BU15DRAFT_78095 [Melanogaster broomeanus]
MACPPAGLVGGLKVIKVLISRHARPSSSKAIPTSMMSSSGPYLSPPQDDTYDTSLPSRPWSPYRRGRKEYNTNWGQDDANRMIYNARLQASYGMNYLAHPIITDGDIPQQGSPPLQVTKNANGSLMVKYTMLAAPRTARWYAGGAPWEAILAIKNFEGTTSNATLKLICISQILVITVAKSTPAQIH